MNTNVKHLKVAIGDIPDEAVRNDLIILMMGLAPCNFDTSFRLSVDGKTMDVDLYMDERQKVLDKLCMIFKDRCNGSAYTRHAQDRSEVANTAQGFSIGMDPQPHMGDGSLLRE